MTALARTEAVAGPGAAGSAEERRAPAIRKSGPRVRLDISRLVSRVGHAAPTGIDRVRWLMPRTCRASSAAISASGASIRSAPSAPWRRALPNGSWSSSGKNGREVACRSAPAPQVWRVCFRAIADYRRPAASLSSPPRAAATGRGGWRHMAGSSARSPLRCCTTSSRLLTRNMPGPPAPKRIAGGWRGCEVTRRTS